ncbi:MAG: sigma-70 family RNA polymerase sigma factor [Candidatus Hydrogenedentes bacterium]|nr:sigma-70 family RNA polymerase sigma factor [Candidatus Hydrogenedentota bacterium]
MSTESQTDEELMCLLCDGTADALGTLVHRYQNDIFRFCLHYVRDVERAREMAQETFIRVYVARARFDASRKFRPWVLCIARNLCLNELKRKKAIPMESLEEYASSAREDTGEVLQSPSDGPDGLLMTAERYELLAEALASLDEESREIVTLRFFERMQARDIAEIVGSTEGAVRTRLHRILKSLRDVYQSAKDDL